jgi:hypothetical protein
MADSPGIEGLAEAPKNASSSSFALALHELRRSVKKLVQSESALARAELKQSLVDLGRDIAQAGILGLLLSLSALSFLAFVILALGRLLNGNFWLSSLIASLVLGSIGGGMLSQGIQKIKSADLTLPRTRLLFQKRSKTTRSQKASQEKSPKESNEESKERRVS